MKYSSVVDDQDHDDEKFSVLQADSWTLSWLPP